MAITDQVQDAHLDHPLEDLKQPISDNTPDILHTHASNFTGDYMKSPISSQSSNDPPVRPHGPRYPTVPHKSVYSVWEQNDEDGKISEELVTVDIPDRRGKAKHSSAGPRHPGERTPSTRSRISTLDGHSWFSSLPRGGGRVVREGHENYLLMYDMLTELMFGSRTGNEMMPKATYDFKFKDYAPWVFRQIRSTFLIEASDYLLSLTGKYVLSEVSSSGKSGSFFYFSQDYRFIIKTISKAEHKFFRRILNSYADHVRTNPNTLLSRILGLHRVKLVGGQKIRFVVMGNVYPANRDIHESYDLKGSLVGRIVREEDVKPTTTFKDLNFLKRGRKIHLGAAKRGLFLEQLNNDVAFLQRMNIMDYSILIGIHHLSKGNDENIRDATLSAFEPSAETLQMRSQQHQSPGANPGPALVMQQTLQRAGRSINGTRSRSLSLSRRRATVSETFVEPSRAVLPEDLPPERKYFAFYSEEGGILSSGALVEGSEGEIYYLGVIDLFTEYSVVKKLEHFFKSLLGNGLNSKESNGNIHAECCTNGWCESNYLGLLVPCQDFWTQVAAIFAVNEGALFSKQELYSMNLVNVNLLLALTAISILKSGSGASSFASKMFKQNTGPQAAPAAAGAPLYPYTVFKHESKKWFSRVRITRDTFAVPLARAGQAVYSDLKPGRPTSCSST
ncbi:Phosphatidylinositol-4-phosphate 5-kinase [Entophlyctis luteolus]|nr:Phosphatidylinositol-4-phosphate 5-kinase [Entophlyctis luteolus]